MRRRPRKGRDWGAYQRTSTAAQPSPPAIYTLARETHTADLAAAPGTARVGVRPNAMVGYAV